MNPTQITTAWKRDQSIARDDALRGIDAEHAARLGLPGLSALLTAAARIERAAGPMSAREVMAVLASAIHAAAGEATARLRLASGDGSARIPMMGAEPRLLLEAELREVTVEEAAELCRDWGVGRGASTAMIRAACAAGTLPARLRGKTWLIRVAELATWARPE